MTINIVLADDHTLIREGVRMILEAQPDMKVVDEAADGRTAVRMVEKHHPDVLIIDISMAELNGIDASQQVHTLYPATKIVMLSMHANEEYVIRALKVGVQCYVLKDASGLDVVNAVRAAYNNRHYLSQQIISVLVSEDNGMRKTRLDRLSSRERETLQLIVEGKSNAQIATALALSQKTVETYRSRLMQKLEISNIPDLVKFAVQQGITSLE